MVALTSEAGLLNPFTYRSIALGSLLPPPKVWLMIDRTLNVFTFGEHLEKPSTTRSFVAAPQDCVSILRETPCLALRITGP